MTCSKTVRQRQARQKRKARINELKAKPCTDCGVCLHPCAMDFDHLDPVKKTANVSVLVQASLKSAEAEIAKCELVCANCHRLRTNRAPRKSGASLNHRRNRRILDQVKALPCFDCGKNYSPCQMDFDHVSGTKKADIARLMEGSAKALLEEIQKCHLVCAACHRIRTHVTDKCPEMSNQVVLDTFIKAMMCAPLEEDARLHSTPAWVALIVEIPASAIAKEYGVSVSTVYWWASKLNLEGYTKEYACDPLLGTMSDVDLAKQCDLSVHVVRNRRRFLKVPAFISPCEYSHVLGTMTDTAVAMHYGKNPEVVRKVRVNLGIPAFGKRAAA